MSSCVIIYLFMLRRLQVVEGHIIYMLFMQTVRDCKVFY